MIRSTVAYALFAVLQSLYSGAQPVSNGHGSTSAFECESDISQVASRPGLRAMRIIEDPATHRRWLLERNTDHPAWPASLIPVRGDFSCCACSIEETTSRRRGLQVQPTVHAGDVLVLVDDAQNWHAEMEAVALSYGSPGDSILVRLRIGGKVTRATVVSKDRAIAASKVEVYR
jgi:hypothetical protein